MRTLTPKEREKIEARIRKIEAENIQLDILADKVSSELDQIVDQHRRNERKVEVLLDRLAEDDLARGK